MYLVPLDFFTPTTYTYVLQSYILTFADPPRLVEYFECNSKKAHKMNQWLDLLVFKKNAFTCWNLGVSQVVL